MIIKLTKELWDGVKHWPPGSLYYPADDAEARHLLGTGTGTVEVDFNPEPLVSIDEPAPAPAGKKAPPAKPLKKGRK